MEGVGEGEGKTNNFSGGSSSIKSQTSIYCERNCSGRNVQLQQAKWRTSAYEYLFIIYFITFFLSFFFLSSLLLALQRLLMKSRYGKSCIEYVDEISG